MKKLVNVFTVLLVLLSFSIGETKEYNNDHFMYYWDKGNENQPLSIDEFKILMKHLEDKIKAFSVAFSKINIADANLTYKAGKTWEVELDFEKQYLKDVFMCLPYVKGDPNSMLNSLVLYVALKDTIQTGYSFSQISVFENCLNNTHIELYFWCKAFQKAHLIPLANAKDLNKELYPMKK